MALAAATPTTTPRRKSVPRPFTMTHWRRWTSDLILDTGQSWHPEDFQDAFVSDVFDEIPECWLILPEGNGKTTLMAGLSLYHCEHRAYASVPVAASSREQAEIMYRQAEGFVLRSERLYATVHSAVQAAKGKRKTEVPRFVCLEGYRRINHHAGGRIQIFAADDRTGDGVIPTLGLLDELHRHRDLALYRVWAGKIAKRGGQIVAISTRGEPGSDFEDTVEKIRTSADNITEKGAFTRARASRLVLHEYAVPDGEDVEDIAVVKKANPLKSVTKALLDEKFTSPTMTMYHWLRFVCNRPTRTENVWLGPDGDKLWNELTDAYELVAKAPSYIGLDLAIKHDTSAAVLMQKRPDGKFHAKARIWTPTDDTPIDLTDVMQWVRDQAAEYDVRAVAFDPKFFDVPAKMLEDEGIPMREVTQSTGRMTTAIGFLYEAVQRRQITHDDDPAFAAQVLGAVPRFGEGGFTLAKSKSRAKIDAAIALALSYDQALRFEGDEPSAYEERGLVAFG